jgi:Rod binding domain-containing protein
MPGWFASPGDAGFSADRHGRGSGVADVVVDQIDHCPEQQRNGKSAPDVANTSKHSHDDNTGLGRIAQAADSR